MGFTESFYIYTHDWFLKLTINSILVFEIYKISLIVLPSRTILETLYKFSRTKIKVAISWTK